MRNRHILTCLFLLTFIPLSVKALPPPSPASGNYLALDGVDDYAVLDFETFGTLLPEGTDEFTIEAWIYPTTPPADDIHAMILSQQVKMDVVNDVHDGWENVRKKLKWQKGDLFLRMQAHIIMKKRVVGTSYHPVVLSPNQWHHIAFQAKEGQTTTIVNDVAHISSQSITLAHDLSSLERPKDFTLGGFGEKIGSTRHTHFWGAFAGYIDEVRISTVARYDVAKEGFTPRDKFKNDAKTVALWHFDEPGGTTKFSDASGNAYHLEGKNGAKTGTPLKVKAQ
ncbi:MAG: LamG domain-containing protein [Candidatus Poribacteria bacterium]|nr:LamG domain-containing protein [Candidatus Poribacteria bacterium]